MLCLDARCIKAVWREAQASGASNVATAATLLLSGDVYTAWNVRKKRFVEGSLVEELAFNAVVLRRHPKAGSAWSHRRWCLERFGSADIDADYALCATLAERYPRNYFAWRHRAWLADQRPETLAFATHWLRTHVTDYSCAHYALSLAAKRPEIFLKDLDALHSDLCTAYPHLCKHPAGALSYFHRIIHVLAGAETTFPIKPLRHARSQKWLDTVAVEQPP